MLKLDDLNWEYFPEGQVQGLNGLVFRFSDDGRQFTIPEGQKEPAREDLTKECEAVLEDVKKKLEEKGLEDDWVDFLLSKKYGFFIGEDMANKNCIDESMILFAMISHISHDLQNEETVEFRKQPPKFAFKGKPINYSGVKQFYENFNVVLIDCDTDAPKNMFAFLDMSKNIFSNCQCVCKNADDVEKFYKNYVESQTAQCDKNRISVIIEDLTNAKEIIAKAAELQIRCQISHKAVGSEVGRL